MGEQAAQPNKQETKENGYHHEEDNIEDESDDNDGEEDMTEEEIRALSNRMDEVNSVLDNLEQKNDDIFNELLSLLQASRDMRQQMQNIPTENKSEAS